MKKVIFIGLYCLFYTFGYSQPIKYEPQELIVKWKSGTKPSSLTNLRTQLNADIIGGFPNLDIEIWKIASSSRQKSNIVELTKAYSRHPDIEYIEPNYIYSINQTIPNELRFGDLWGMNNTGQSGGTFNADIDAIEGWDIIKESPSIKVAIIDTGIDWGHPDLVDNIWQNSGEDADGDGHVLEWDGNEWIFDPGDENGIDDDGNGYIDDFVGWDFNDNDNDPYDGNAHGTHVAGIVGANGNNGIGVTGVSWKVQMAALKFLSDDGHGSTSNAIAALNYAVNMGMHISNNSWGGAGFSTALYNAIQNAAAQNHLFVAAAGNDGINTDNLPIYPANYNVANIISVAATDRNDNRSSFSNYGLNSVDLGAPGSAILSSFPNNSYKAISGTSMAAPYIAGACALLWELHPTKTYSDIKSDLLNTVDIIPALHGETVSGGRLNLCKLLGGCSVDVSCTFSDSLTLANFYKATDGANWLNTWDLSQPINTWYGIDTNAEGCVISIDLNNNQLTGVIPTELSNLFELQSLDLSNNQLIGTISSKLGSLENLQMLDLSHNQLTGQLLAELGNLSNLQTLDLSHNQLEGSIPIEFGNLVTLDTLILNHNQLERNIPKELGQLSNLQVLYLQNNQLSGCFNQSLNVLCSIDYDLSNNLLPTGGFLDFCSIGTGNCHPCSFVDSLALITLYFTTNGINWTNPWNLQEPMSTWNGITLNSEGCVVSIDLDNNNLAGRFPTELLDLPISILAAFSDNLPNLTRLSLRNNQLTGGISSEIGNLSNIKTLFFDGNQLSGRIPKEIGMLTNLDSLGISNNQLSDTIPKELGKLAKLSWLSLENNQITGEIPLELGQLTNIKTLNLSNNQLEGAIPATLSNLYNLDSLNLSYNHLVGHIPDELGNLFNLKSLDFSNNQLIGNISIASNRLSSLQEFLVANNNLSGCFSESLSSFCNINSDFTNNDNLPGNGDFSAFCAGEIGVCTEPVWPGDFNNDGIANHKDLLFWGLACEGITGPARSNASTNWEEQESTNWSTTVNNVNNKHQDANGDGIINIQDYQVLEANYGETHNVTISTHATNDITYRLEPLGYLDAHTFRYALYMEDTEGNPVNVHGLSASINFGDLPISASLDITNSSISPQQHLSLFNETENTLDIALTRTDKTNQLTDGPVGILIVISESYALNDPILLKVENGSKIVADGTFNAVAGTEFYDIYSNVAPSSTNILVSVSVTNEECDKLGSAKVNILGGVSPYTILWSTGANTAQINNLNAGNYSVMVTDINGLTATYEVTVKGQYLPIYDENGELVDCASLDCQPSLVLANMISAGTHQVATTITADGTIETDSDVAFKAGESITLKAGFQVEAGATFVASIEDCTQENDNNYTSIPIYQTRTTLKESTLTLNQMSLQISPNPFTNQAIIEYELPTDSPIQLAVYNAQGNLINLLVDNLNKVAGQHQTTFLANDLPKGLYLISLKTKDRIETKKMILLE